jgi:hypothetical protein
VRITWEGKQYTWRKGNGPRRRSRAGPCVLNVVVTSLPISFAAFVRVAKSNLNRQDGCNESEVSCGDNLDMEFIGELASSHIDVSMAACTKFDGIVS